MKLTDVYSGWDDTFRQISQSTGGEVVIGNLLKRSLKLVADREDIFYRLTYRPSDIKNEKRKINITSHIKNLNIIHESKIKVSRPKYIELSEVSYSAPILTIKLNNYHLIAVGQKQAGDVQLEISGENSKGKTMKYMKKMALETSESTISLKLNIPRDNQINLSVIAWDNLSGLKAQKSI